MPNPFTTKKNQILAQLSLPEASYTDLSPKGSIDSGVRSLCNEINASEGLVTTSSCAGRIAVFLEGRDGIKGGGRWLYVSHEPVRVPDAGEICALFGIEGKGNACLDVVGASCQFVHFKFEPMILHILTASLSEAQRAESAAMSAGFRESGISGISGSEPTPMVAVRTQGLALDCIIGYKDDSGTIVPMVSEAYLRTVLSIANQRFTVNAERKERFRQALFAKSEALDQWEPADVRRERKRAEGLRRQEVKRKEMDASLKGNGAVDHDDEPLDTAPSLDDALYA